MIYLTNKCIYYRLIFLIVLQSFIMDEKFLIAITGKSGVGKSVFSKELADTLNGELISFDKISHLSLENDEIKSKIRAVFGDEVFEKNAILRKKLGKIAFNDQNKLNFLNSISQEFMENYIDNLIQVSKKHYIILEYALLTKMKYFNFSNYKILIYAIKTSRFDRLKLRDNVSEDYLELRENNLPDFNEKDFDEVIDNSSNLNLEKLAKTVARNIKNAD